MDIEADLVDDENAADETAVDSSTGDVAAPAVVSAGPDRQQMQLLTRWADHTQTPNIAEELKAEQLNEIGRKAKEEYEIDLQSLSGWLDKSRDAIKLAMQITEPKTNPWPGASNVIFPLMTVASVQFAARAYPAIIAGRNVVKGVVVGEDNGTPMQAPDGSPAVQVDPRTGQPAMGPNGQPQIMWQIAPGEKRRRADVIGAHMSWQLLEEMEDWEEETDKLLHVLPILGCTFRKSYFDPSVGCNESVLVMPQNLVVNYWAKALERAPRITEEQKFYPVEIEENERSGIWLEQDYGLAPGSGNDKDAPHEFLEQHRRIDLDGDGYPEPYIVTLNKESGKVARIVARFDLDGVMLSRTTHQVMQIKPVHYYTQYNFLPNIDGGLYGMGFGQLLSPINATVNTLINELIDSGHLANTQGGFIGKGLSMHAGSVRFKKGEFKTVNVPGAAIRDAIVPMSFSPPSAVLFQLLGLMIDAGKEISSVKDVLTGDASIATMQPTTLLALIEQGLKVFTGIYKRIYRAEKKELAKLYRLNRIYLQNESQYQDGDEWKVIRREDYMKGSGVIPVSDPAMVSDMQRAARAQFLQGYQNDPHCDPIEIRRRVFDAASIENPEAIFAKNSGPPPQLILAEMQQRNETIKTRAAAIKDLAAAQKYLAEADKAAGETAIRMIQHHFAILQQELAMLSGPSPAEPGAGQPQAPAAQSEAAPSPASAALPAPAGAAT